MALAVGCIAFAGACNHEPRVTACGLVNALEVQRATGGVRAIPRPVVQSSDDSEAGRSFCLWLRAGELPPEGTFIGVIQDHEMTGAVRRTGFSADAVFSAAKAKATNPELVKWSGLRGSAFWADSRLQVLSRGAYVSVTVDPAARDPRATAIELGRLAAARLPRR